MTIKLRRSDIFIAEYNKYGVSSGGAVYVYAAPPELTNGYAISFYKYIAPPGLNRE